MMITITSQEFIDYLTGKITSPLPTHEQNIECSVNHINFNDVAVSGNTILTDITINKRVRIISGQYSINFEKVYIKEWFRISGGTFFLFVINNAQIVDKGSISIDGGIFKNVFKINGGLYENNFSISGGEFENGLTITGGIFKKYLQLTGGEFNRWINISNCHVDGWLYLHRTIFEYGIQIHSGYFKDLNIWQCPGLNNIYINGPVIIGTINIKADQALKVFCSNININILNLNDTTFQKDVNLFVTDSIIDQVQMERFYNFGYICFNNLMPYNPYSPITKAQNSSMFFIKNSNIGRLDFIECNMEIFKIEFENSKIDDISILGGTNFKNISVPKGTSKSLLNKQKRLFNGQMKKVFENKGDSISAVHSHSEDMNAYFNSLSWNWKKIFSYENWEIINLYMNKISTNHGKSWSKGVCSLLITSTFFYCLYIYSLGYCLTKISGKSVNEFFNISSFLIEFINPIHKADFIADSLGVTSTISSRFVEGISRVFIAYFVYQLIQAFRKHSRRSM